MTVVPAASRRGLGQAARIWWMGARPRTLGVGAVPVLIGAAASGHAKAFPTVAALIVAISLQAGANLANDYFDGVRGVDSPARVGPRRLTAGGLMPPGAVLGASLACLGVAAVIGVWLILASGLAWLLIAGAAALVAALLYTGGPRPYAATGVVADLAVFAFFGLMATVGSAAVQGAGVPERTWWAAVAIGLAAVAVLDANNLRDLDSDAAAGRHTLAVRLGDRRARRVYAALIVGTVVVPVAGVAAGRLPAVLLAVLLAIPVAVGPLRLVRRHSGDARGLAPLLPLTVRFHLFAGVLLAAALLLADLASGSPLAHPLW
ncbi:MAG: 1,4-dihydroxy-2-naphthoate octaprenyltransferase [Candidatus Dormibacteria bacterium]